MVRQSAFAGEHVTRLRPAFLLVSLVLHAVALWLLAQAALDPLPKLQAALDVAPTEALVIVRPIAPAPRDRIAAPRLPPQAAPARSTPPRVIAPKPGPPLIEQRATPGVAPGRGRVGLYGALAELMHCQHADLLFEVSAAQVEACEARRVFARRERMKPLPIPGERLFAGASRDPNVQRLPSNTCADARVGLECLD